MLGLSPPSWGTGRGYLLHVMLGLCPPRDEGGVLSIYMPCLIGCCLVKPIYLLPLPLSPAYLIFLIWPNPTFFHNPKGWFRRVFGALLGLWMHLSWGGKCSYKFLVSEMTSRFEMLGVARVDKEREPLDPKNVQNRDSS